MARTSSSNSTVPLPSASMARRKAREAMDSRSSWRRAWRPSASMAKRARDALFGRKIEELLATAMAACTRVGRRVVDSGRKNGSGAAAAVAFDLCSTVEVVKKSVGTEMADADHRRRKDKKAGRWMGPSGRVVLFYSLRPPSAAVPASGVSQIRPRSSMLHCTGCSRVFWLRHLLR